MTQNKAELETAHAQIQAYEKSFSLLAKTLGISDKPRADGTWIHVLDEIRYLKNNAWPTKLTQYIKEELDNGNSITLTTVEDGGLLFVVKHKICNPHITLCQWYGGEDFDVVNVCGNGLSVLNAVLKLFDIEPRV